MTVLTIESPVTLRISDVDDTSFLKTLLQYRDKKVDFELQKFRHSTWYADKYGRQAYQERLKELQDSRIKSLLFEDDRGYWTYTGLAGSLARNLKAEEPESLVVYPEASVIPWSKKPFDMYPYQREAYEALLKARHAGVEIGTGLGKSLIINYIIKALALKTVVMAPSKSIARQLYEGHDGRGGFKAAFGSKYVGLYGDGRKDTGKLITVAIAASLTRIEPGDSAWKALSGTQVFVADESHLCPAVTLAKVCFGLLAAAPYRFFFSATQMRNDGLDMLLDSITGPVVYRMSVQEGIQKGYLAALDFTMAQVTSDSSFESRDANEMTRKHLYDNPRVNKCVAQLANSFASRNQQVLILIDELDQFNKIYGQLRYEVGFAHGGGSGEREALPEAFRKADNADLVQRFNEGRLPILVGTSAVSIGTDIKANQATIYVKGGKSEIEVMQGAVGRSTRLHPEVGKTRCQVIDFSVVNKEVLRRHADARQKIYETVAPVKEWAIG